MCISLPKNDTNKIIHVRYPSVCPAKSTTPQQARLNTTKAHILCTGYKANSERSRPKEVDTAFFNSSKQAVALLSFTKCQSSDTSPQCTARWYSKGEEAPRLASSYRDFFIVLEAKTTAAAPTTTPPASLSIGKSANLRSKFEFELRECLSQCSGSIVSWSTDIRSQAILETKEGNNVKETLARCPWATLAQFWWLSQRPRGHILLLTYDTSWQIPGIGIQPRTPHLSHCMWW